MDLAGAPFVSGGKQGQRGFAGSGDMGAYSAFELRACRPTIPRI
jgi:hypothetical protein